MIVWTEKMLYEKYGWNYLGNGYDVSGEETRIYHAPTIPVATSEYQSVDRNKLTSMAERLIDKHDKAFEELAK